MSHNRMKWFVGVVVVFAVIMGIIGMILPVSLINVLVTVHRFLEVVIPVLGVGALLKYLFSCPADKK